MDRPRFGQDSNPVPVQNATSLAFQAKLKIGQPNDKYEQEADRMAEQVMRMPEPRQTSLVGDSPMANTTIPLSETIQRACASCSEDYKTAENKNRSTKTANLCPKCWTEEGGLIQTKLSESPL